MPLALAAAMSLCLLAPQRADADDAAAALAEVQRYYAGIDQSTARFEQTHTNAAFGKVESSSGEVRVKKPGKMRWDYANKARKGKAKRAKASYISDGKTLWVVDHLNYQAARQSLADTPLPAAVSFLFGQGDLSQDFTAAIDATGSYGTAADTVLLLTPKVASAQYQRLYLIVADDGHVAQSVIVDPAGNTTLYAFIAPDTATTIKDRMFTFDPDSKAAKNYRIVDPKAPAKKAPAKKAPAKKAPAKKAPAKKER